MVISWICIENNSGWWEGKDVGVVCKYGMVVFLCWGEKICWFYLWWSVLCGYVMDGVVDDGDCYGVNIIVIYIFLLGLLFCFNYFFFFGYFGYCWLV